MKHTLIRVTTLLASVIGLASVLHSAAAADNEVHVTTPAALRETIVLDGTWQIAEGTMTDVPATFERTVPVPGLVDMAVPAFVEPGPKVANRGALPQKDPRRDAFWYRRTFKLAGPIPEVATLKINKAMFGTRAFLNGKPLGDHAPCFTPGFFDVKNAVRTGENELVIRVGADRDAVGRGVPDGFDFEKDRYLPGIFDSVSLILSGSPRIENVQVVPDIDNKQAKVLVYLAGTNPVPVTVEIGEAKSGELAGQATTTAPEVVVPIRNCRLWSPEDPFLYRVTVRTHGDAFTTRFGMREFHFDPATRRAVLNGKPYFMRGSNITLYRFFEDGERGRLPWDDAWVRKLHRRVKDMHWNCLRYCIGLPPERWYEIADEEGILIQNEFPIWYVNMMPELMTVEELEREYSEWLRDQWNHPCVVIWDASNETHTKKTGDALMRVRGLDLSDRPWDDGFNWPRCPGDTSEQHPYHYMDNKIRLRNLATANPDPESYKNGGGDGKHAVIINEYGWLWVNRDGTPTTLTHSLYSGVLGANATPAQRLHIQATWLAADTEFWRAHRQAAAVMHFTTLGYSRPDGQTSDNWTQGGVAKLEWEPEFYRYVRDAFAPVGLMIDAWAEDYPAAAKQDFPVMLINDLPSPWQGEVRFRILRDGETIVEQKHAAEIAGWGSTNMRFTIRIPEQHGHYEAEATLLATPVGVVRSVREFNVGKKSSL